MTEPPEPRDPQSGNRTEYPEPPDERTRTALDAGGRPAAGPPPAETLPDETFSPETTDNDGRPARRGPLPVSVGGYRVLGLLGTGGMGAVYLADDPLAGRRVAVKVMRPELAAHRDAVERFLREGRLAATVEHDHVVPIYRVDRDQGVPFIVMPLLRGESLDARLARDPRPQMPLVLKVGREVALGLAAAHDKGLIHRDVKPANVWLEGGPEAAEPADRVRRAKVLDFGLARAADAADGLTRPGAVVGTPAYMAPEQAGGRDVDHRADLFSLGAVLYRMAAGRPAFDAPSLTALLVAVATHTPTPPAEVNPAVPPALSDLIMRLLAKDPAARPASARAVADELARIEAGTALTVPPPARPRPRRWAWAAAAGVVLGVVALAAWALTRNDGRPETAANPPAGPPVVPPVTPGTETPARGAESPPKYRGSVDILVAREDDDGSLKLFPLSDPRAMPLRPGDDVRVEATVAPAAYLYLFWIDEAGEAAPVYPWELGKWGTRPAGEKPVGAVDVKSAAGKYPRITGSKAGMETLLMIARPTPLEANDDEVQKWFAGLRPLPLRGTTARAWFEDFDLLRADPIRRGIGYDGDPAVPDGPLGLQAVLRQRIGQAAGFSRAISFARLGRKEQK